jgi:hypothetical protein
MRKITPYLILCLVCVTFCPRPAAALNFSAPKPKFGYTDAAGKKQAVEIVDKYYPKKMTQPFGNNSKIDPKLRRAATIAEERARAHSLSKCWRYVKEALVAAGVVKSRPQTPLAKQAGQELVNNYGFKKLRERFRQRFPLQDAVTPPPAGRFRQELSRSFERSQAERKV